MDAVFRATQKHAAKIAFVNFFLLYDFSLVFVNNLLHYYRLPNPRFRPYPATLGLRQADGTPRQAWQRFERHIAEWHRRP